jgi:hypothetical protein
VDQAEETPVDPGDTVENLTEVRNQGSEDPDPTAPNPTQEGKPGHILLFYYIAIYIYLYILCIKFLGIA